eukprot:scaffold58910_cov65-Phaeocystis_antarctica.AAC.7
MGSGATTRACSRARCSSGRSRPRLCTLLGAAPVDQRCAAAQLSPPRSRCSSRACAPARARGTPPPARVDAVVAPHLS